MLNYWGVFFLSPRGGLPLYHDICSISQWYCRASGSLWTMLDSNPGPLPKQSKALPMSHIKWMLTGKTYRKKKKRKKAWGVATKETLTSFRTWVRLFLTAILHPAKLKHNLCPKAVAHCSPGLDDGACPVMGDPFLSRRGEFRALAGELRRTSLGEQRESIAWPGLGELRPSKARPGLGEFHRLLDSWPGLGELRPSKARPSLGEFRRLASWPGLGDTLTRRLALTVRPIAAADFADHTVAAGALPTAAGSWLSLVARPKAADLPTIFPAAGWLAGTVIAAELVVVLLLPHVGLNPNLDGGGCCCCCGCCVLSCAVDLGKMRRADDRKEPVLARLEGAEGRIKPDPSALGSTKKQKHFEQHLSGCKLSFIFMHYSSYRKRLM